MKPANNLENLIKELPVTTRPEFDREVLSDAARVLSRSACPVSEHDPNPSLFRKIIMKNTWVKFVAAAAVLIVISLLTVFALEKSATPAYALEQTIAANHSIRFIHIIIDKNMQCNPSEIWAQFDDLGHLVRYRMDMLQTEVGPMSMTWQNGKSQYWIRAKKMQAVLNEQNYGATMSSMVEKLEPKVMVENLRSFQAQGKVAINIMEPQNPADPIVVTATHLPKSHSPDAKEVLYIHPTTKLVTKMEVYVLKNKKYELTFRMRVLDYNQPIGDKIFVLDVPKDVIAGLPQGSLTKDEIAVKVVREYIEAWITGDYDKMGKLAGGVPGSMLKEAMQKQMQKTKFKIIRIVSIGKPEQSQRPPGIRVPCTLEAEFGGKKLSIPFPSLVRQKDGYPDHWIFAGQ
jgi:hypothetical protein